MTDLCALTVAQAAEAIRGREVSPVDLVQSLLDRIDATEPALHAWAYVAGEEAIRAARQAQIEDGLGNGHSPVFGVPFAAKDIFDTAGIPTEAGSLHYQGRVPAEDAAPIRRLKAAGAILLGKVHTTEFADGHPSPTRNPYHLDHSPGGSSSGSAAAVSARTVPFALGSQTVGSVLRPAAFCGVVGFKPTFGRVGRQGVIPMSDSFDHVGWLTRTVEDAAIALRVLAGFEPDDPHSEDMPVDGYIEAARTLARPPRIGLLHFYFDGADAAMRQSTLAAVERLARAGAVVDDTRLDLDFDTTFRAHRAMQLSEMAWWHQREGLLERMDLYQRATREFLERGLAVSGVEYYDALQVRRGARARIAARLREVDILVSPTTSAPAPPLSEQSTGQPAWQSPWSLTGFPSITLPTGLTPDGLPTAIQLGAAEWQEAKLLSIAAWVEQALDVHLPPPRI